MDALQPTPRDQLKNFAYDLRVDVSRLKEVIEVNEIFFSKADVIERFQPWVDECNENFDSEEEKYAVFDGGFFYSTQGYIMDELFK